MTTSTLVRPAPSARSTRSRAGVLLMEFIGSTLLGLAGYWAIYQGVPREPQTLLYVATAFGGVMMLLGLAMAKWGVHLNPYVSIGSAVQRTTTWGDAILRSLVQLLGFVLAIYLALLQFGPQAARVAYGVPIPAPSASLAAQLFVGFLAGLGFTAAALLAVSKMSGTGAAVVIGLALGIAIYYSAEKAGGGVNLARNIAPMLWSGKFMLLPTIGELLGAVTAGLLMRRVR